MTITEWMSAFANRGYTLEEISADNGEVLEYRLSNGRETVSFQAIAIDHITLRVYTTTLPGQGILPTYFAFLDDAAKKSSLSVIALDIIFLSQGQRTLEGVEQKIRETHERIAPFGYQMSSDNKELLDFVDVSSGCTYYKEVNPNFTKDAFQEWSELNELVLTALTPKHPFERKNFLYAKKGSPPGSYLLAFLWPYEVYGKRGNIRYLVGHGHKRAIEINTGSKNSLIPFQHGEDYSSILLEHLNAVKEKQALRKLLDGKGRTE